MEHGTFGTSHPLMGDLATKLEHDGTAKATPIVVFVHIHYPDVWQEMAQRLSECLDVPFRLVITSSLPHVSTEIPPTPFHQGTTFISVENRGRDIRPFLLALPQAGQFDIGLKLHTKKSTHRLEGEAWRENVLASLIASDPPPSELVQAFSNQKRLGLLAPSGFLLPVREWMLMNRRPMQDVVHAIDQSLTRSELAQATFAAGSMFWFRYDAIAELTSSKLPDLFETEKGQTDGTIAHAIERLFGALAARKDYAVLSMNAVPTLTSVPSNSSSAELVRMDAEEISPFFRKPLPARLVAKHLPFLFAAYGRLPISWRRVVRDFLIRNV